MTSIDQHLEPGAAWPAAAKDPGGRRRRGGTRRRSRWPAFGVTTFMLSMINARPGPGGDRARWCSASRSMFGGLTQLIAGVILLRVGNTFGGVLFSGFGAFWLSLCAIAEFFLKAIPAAQAGHALGLFLYAFGIFAVMDVRRLVPYQRRGGGGARVDLIATFVRAGRRPATRRHSGLVKTGGWLGLVAGGARRCTCRCAEVCEATYGREVLPIGHAGEEVAAGHRHRHRTGSEGQRRHGPLRRSVPARA